MIYDLNKMDIELIKYVGVKNPKYSFPSDQIACIIKQVISSMIYESLGIQSLYIQLQCTDRYPQQTIYLISLLLLSLVCTYIYTKITDVQCGREIIHIIHK